MPLLSWFRREEDLTRASLAPYRLLEPIVGLSYGEPDSPNMLIEGDNLDALKALLPYYAGQVKCIFIDPPYNTRSAFEHYDDSLEHSIWLSMMYARLELLREFLSEDGTIWVTIDDHEGPYLKVLMDEVFARKNFVATVVWQSRYSRSSDTAISNSHNFIHVYAADPDKWKTVRNRLPRSPEQEKQFKNPDGDPQGPWRAIPWDAPNVRANLSYPIVTPSGNVRLPPPGRHWSRTEDQWLELVEKGLAYFGRNQDGAPSFKQYLHSSPPIVPNTWWNHEESGHTDEAKKEAQALFGNDNLFGTPKPERLIQRILHIASNPGDLVLDSFLGSGTTAAVAQKMGRRWIGIEVGEQARTMCQPRLKKVVDGDQGGVSKAVGWAGGGGFRFFKLGGPIFDDNGHIRADIRFEQLASHVWFTETGTPRSTRSQKSPFLGEFDGVGYYLLFNGVLGDVTKTGGNVLTARILKALPKFDGPKVIYGEACLLSEEQLADLELTFKQTPYDIKSR